MTASSTWKIITTVQSVSQVKQEQKPIASSSSIISLKLPRDIRSFNFKSICKSFQAAGAATLKALFIYSLLEKFTFMLETYRVLSLHWLQVIPTGF